MTVVIGSIWGNKSIIAADSLVTSGDCKVNNLKNFSKLIRFNNWAVGFAGDCSVFQILSEMSRDKVYLKHVHMRMRNIDDAAIFVKEVCSRLKTTIDCSPAFHKDKDDEFLVEMLIVTKTSIYEADSYMFISECTRFSTIGCGGDIALGAMSALYKNIKDEEELLKVVEESVNITCKNSTQCGGPLSIIVLGE